MELQIGWCDSCLFQTFPRMRPRNPFKQIFARWAQVCVPALVVVRLECLQETCWEEWGICFAYGLLFEQFLSGFCCRCLELWSVMADAKWGKVSSLPPGPSTSAAGEQTIHFASKSESTMIFSTLLNILYMVSKPQRRYCTAIPPSICASSLQKHVSPARSSSHVWSTSSHGLLLLGLKN